MQLISLIIPMARARSKNCMNVRNISTS